MGGGRVSRARPPASRRRRHVRERGRAREPSDVRRESRPRIVLLQPKPVKKRAAAVRTDQPSRPERVEVGPVRFHGDGAHGAQVLAWMRAILDEHGEIRPICVASNRWRDSYSGGSRMFSPSKRQERTVTSLASH